MFRFIAGLLIGAGAGAVGAYLYLKNKFEKAYELRVKSMETFVEKYKKMERARMVEAPVEERQIKSTDAIDIPQAPTDLQVERRAERVDYSTFYEGHDYPEEDSEAYSESEYLNNYFNTEPFIEQISVDESGTMGDACPEELLLFWAQDDIFTTEENLILDDPRMYIGDFVRHFQHNDDDEDDIFIRNKKMRKDFQVSKMTGFFNSEIVMKYDGEAEELE